MCEKFHKNSISYFQKYSNEIYIKSVTICKDTLWISFRDSNSFIPIVNIQFSSTNST